MKKHTFALFVPCRIYRSSVVFLLLAILTVPVRAQQVLTGRVVDKQTQAPVTYAHIFLLQDQRTGVFSNDAGQFQFSIKAGGDSDTLVVSQIGYQTAFIPVKGIGDELKIQLEATSYQLNEVTVLSDQALSDIVRRAIEKIPDNYGAETYTLGAYYQEYTITDDAYTELIEAFVNIQDGMYTSPKQESVIKLEALRKSDDRRNGEILFQEAKINQIIDLYEGSNHVRSRSFHPYAGEGEKNLLKKFDFYNLGEYVENGDTLIRVGFAKAGKESSDKDRSYARGEIVICKSDLGITRITRDASNYGVYHESTYQKIDGTYYPQKIVTRLNTLFRGESEHTHINSRQLFIYGILPPDRSDRGEILVKKENLRRSTIAYDETFWKNNAILQPVPAEGVMEMDMERSRSLEEQFRANANRTKFKKK
jgi:hypothetical protein